MGDVPGSRQERRRQARCLRSPRAEPARAMRARRRAFAGSARPRSATVRPARIRTRVIDEFDRRDFDAAWIEPGIGSAGMPQHAHEDARRARRAGRARDPPDDERASQPRPSGRRPGAGLEQAVPIALRASEGRHHTEGHGHAERQRHREGQYPPVERERYHDRDGSAGRKSFAAGSIIAHGRHRAGRRRGTARHLGQQWSNETSAPGAECRPQRHLRARGRPGQHDAGDVRAGRDEHERDERDQRPGEAEHDVPVPAGARERQRVQASGLAGAAPWLRSIASPMAATPPPRRRWARPVSAGRRRRRCRHHRARSPARCRTTGCPCPGIRVPRRRPPSPAAR